MPRKKKQTLPKGNWYCKDCNFGFHHFPSWQCPNCGGRVVIQPSLKDHESLEMLISQILVLERGYKRMQTRLDEMKLRPMPNVFESIQEMQTYKKNEEVLIEQKEKLKVTLNKSIEEILKLKVKAINLLPYRNVWVKVQVRLPSSTNPKADYLELFAVGYRKEVHGGDHYALLIEPWSKKFESEDIELPKDIRD